jgi:hypothetical protein
MRVLAADGIYPNFAEPLRTWPWPMWWATLAKGRRIVTGERARANTDDLTLLKDLIEQGHVRAVIESALPARPHRRRASLRGPRTQEGRRRGERALSCGAGRVPCVSRLLRLGGGSDMTDAALRRLTVDFLADIREESIYAVYSQNSTAAASPSRPPHCPDLGSDTGSCCATAGGSHPDRGPAEPSPALPQRLRR